MLTSWWVSGEAKKVGNFALIMTNSIAQLAERLAQEGDPPRSSCKIPS
jgi:hypothetical protein